MTDENFDPFELASGFTDDVDVAFKTASFGFRSDFADFGNPLLLIIDAIVDADDGPVEQELIFPCGKGWELKPGSKIIAQREDGKRKNFIKTSAVGLLISHALEAGAPLRDLAVDDNGPMNASMWDNTIWHMKQIEINYGGEIGKKSRLLPTEYKGRAGGKATTPAVVTETTVVPNANLAAVPDAPPTANGKLSARTKVEIRKLNESYRAEGKSYEDYLEAGLALVEGNSEGEDYVMADDFAY